MKGAGVVLVAWLAATSAAAQEPTPLRWGAHEQIPSRISDVLVGTNLALDGWHSFRAEDHAERWAYVCRVGVAFGVGEVIKRLVARERPNGHDAGSFPSQHTAVSVATSGYRRPVGPSIAVAVAWGRQAGGWHYGSDVAVGAGIGLLARKVC